jgi:hypothetical protein
MKTLDYSSSTSLCNLSAFTATEVTPSLVTSADLLDTIIV